MPEPDLPKDLSWSTECQSTVDDGTTGTQDARDHKITVPKIPKGLRFSDNGSGIDIQSVNSERAKSTKSPSGYWTTPKGLKERVSFARTKSLQQLIMEDKGRLERVRKAQDAKDLKAKRDAENKAKDDQRKADKELARRYNKEKKKRQAEEKRNSMKWGGIVRGFDPNAGLLRCTASESTLRHTRTRLERGQQNHDSLVDILHPMLDKGQTWGVEHGAKGKKARFGISSSVPSGSFGGSGFGGFDGGDD